MIQNSPAGKNSYLTGFYKILFSIALPIILQNLLQTFVNMMDTKLYETRGSTINNFALTLAKTEGECAKEILKDEYKLDFLSLRETYEERDLHKALEQHLVQFLLELGSGFAFVGSHVPFVVNGDEYEMDLLFYHLKLRRYIVVELKVVKFQPEFVSKLNFYISAVDDQLKTEEDKPTIGLLLCRSKSNIKAEYSLRGFTQPLGIAEYETQKILNDVKSSLPSIEEIEANLQGES